VVEFFVVPFEVSFVQRGLWAGLAVAVLCALVGTWVVLRGAAFLGDAMAHGMLPGIAVAGLLGLNPALGAVASAALMGLGVTAVARNPRTSQDTGIGLLFAGMLAVGVIAVSRSQSFATDLAGILFGDILAVRAADLRLILGALALGALLVVLCHRPLRRSHSTIARRQRSACARRRRTMPCSAWSR
jgi:zinc/manganese transport system permease protein